VATKSGVSRKALRLYERAGILPPARRTAAGYRVYTDDKKDEWNLLVELIHSGQLTKI
jgi:DNA-binding transcriptional MerR regulator